LEGRLTFHHVDGTPGPGNSGGPSVLVAYGRTAWNRLHCCELPGAFASNWEFLGKARGYGISTENTTERPEDAARRFAGKVIELQAQLATKDAEIARLTNELTAKQVELEALEEGMIAAHESETIILNELATKDAEIEDWRVRTIKVTNELADTALTVTRLEAENKRLREVFTELLEDHAQTVDGEWGSGNGELKQQIIEDWGAKILAPDKEGK